MRGEKRIEEKRIGEEKRRGEERRREEKRRRKKLTEEEESEERRCRCANREKSRETVFFHSLVAPESTR